jgi:hypothetical protein
VKEKGGVLLRCKGESPEEKRRGRLVVAQSKGGRRSGGVRLMGANGEREGAADGNGTWWGEGGSGTCWGEEVDR